MVVSSILVIASTTFLAGLEVTTSQLSVSLVPLFIAVAFVSTLIMSKTIHVIDPKSTSSNRRILGLLLVATIIWIIPTAIGLIASPLLGPEPVFNEFVFGAFLAWTFEAVVVNGVFLKGTALSLCLAALYPLPILAAAAYTRSLLPVYPIVSGMVVLLLAIIFLIKLKSMKTNNGIASLQLLKAFLKTWVSHEPDELEDLFSTYAKKERVKTEIILIKTRNKVAFILPGIHPGPFSPVGSYNLSELIYLAVKNQLVTPVVLHGVGGHERNTPTNALASSYAQQIDHFINSANMAESGSLKGPLHTKVDITNITTFCFGKVVVAIISNSPYLSDDLDPAVVASAYDAASELGLEVLLVDAHNSVDGESRNQPTITKAKWKEILDNTTSLVSEELGFGFAHSSEINFEHGLDISDGGIGVAIFSTAGLKWVLVTADSNNATSSLREKMSERLRKAGFALIELCTSDTHNFAARNLSRRGYLPLGEGTDIERIIDAVEQLSLAAEKRIDACQVDVASFESDIPLIGHASLDDFASLTARTTAFARNYSKILVPVSVLLVLVTLFY